jgi:hypothetical protein
MRTVTGVEVRMPGYASTNIGNSSVLSPPPPQGIVNVGVTPNQLNLGDLTQLWRTDLINLNATTSPTGVWNYIGGLNVLEDGSIDKEITFLFLTSTTFSDEYQSFPSNVTQYHHLFLDYKCLLKREKNMVCARLIFIQMISQLICCVR